MTHPPDDPDRAVLARLGQQVAPPPGAYHELVQRLMDTGRIRPPAGMAGWLGAALAATAAAVIAVLAVPDSRPGREFLLLLEEPAGYQAPVGPDQIRARVNEYAGWARVLASGEHLVSAGELEPGGMKINAASSRTISGPASPTGYFLVRARSLADAERLARESPHLKYGGEVMIRPVVH
jgi:hypothetical protein